MRIGINNYYSFVICTLLKRKVMVCPPLPMRKNEKIIALGNGLAQERIFFVCDNCLLNQNILNMGEIKKEREQLEAQKKMYEERFNLQTTL